MTDAFSTALADLDQAISSISGELSTLVEQVQQLTQQIANGNPSSDLAAEIETRAKSIQDAVTAAQSAIPTPSQPQSEAPAPSLTPAPESAEQISPEQTPTPEQPDPSVPPASPSVSTPVEDTGPAKASGSPMG